MKLDKWDKCHLQFQLANLSLFLCIIYSNIGQVNHTTERKYFPYAFSKWIGSCPLDFYRKGTAS